MWRSTRREAEALQQGGLGEECEAFLAGEWVEYLEAHGEPVPSCCWLNHVAHAGEAELRATAGALERARPNSDGWSQAASFLAGELLDAAEEWSTDVSELQRSRLVPLELALFEDPASRRLNPGQPSARALSAIRHGSSRRL
jgi:hypothetical protein